MSTLAIPSTEELSGKKFYHRDFRGHDLSKRNVRNSLFFACNFNEANLSESKFRDCDFTSSTFVDTIAYKTEFVNCRLAGIEFSPKDAFGVAWSMNCRTFDSMAPSPLWGMAYLMFFLMMKHKGEMAILADKIIAAIGAEKYLRLKTLFEKREL